MTEVQRLISPVLSNIPWYTTAVVQHDDFTKLDGLQSFETFLRHLQQYESRLFSLGGCSESIMEMQRLLRLGTGQGTELIRLSASPTELGSRGATKVCGLVCAYRLLDVIAMLVDYTPNGLHLERRLLAVDKMLHGMDKLGDWPEVVRNFRTIIQRLRIHATDKLPDTSSPAPVRLLHLLARNQSSQNYSKIEGNFLVAAVYIAFMKEFAFTHDSFPDIPDNLEMGAGHLPFFTAHQQDLLEVSTLMNKTGQALTGKTDALPLLRAPLQLALLISPIYLFLPIQLYKRSFNRELLLSIGQSLGNRKPAIIVEVEKAIWRVIFSLVDGPLLPVQLLCQLSKDLPWDQINSAENNRHGNWFDLTRNFHILDSNGAYTAEEVHPGVDISPDMADESNPPEEGDLSVVVMAICQADVTAMETNSAGELNLPKDDGQSTASVCATNLLSPDVPGIDPSLASPPLTTHDSSSSLSGVPMDQGAIEGSAEYVAIDEGRAVECVDEWMEDGENEERSLFRPQDPAGFGREEHIDRDMDEHDTTSNPTPSFTDHNMDEHDATANPTLSSTVVRAHRRKVLPVEPILLHRRKRRANSPEIESGETGGPRNLANAINLSGGFTHLNKKASRNTPRGPLFSNVKSRKKALKSVHSKQRVVPLEAGESRENPINVEEYLLTVETEKKIFPCISDMKWDLSRSVTKRYKLDCSLNMWDVHGMMIQKSFKVHHEADARNLQKIIEAVNKNYIDGRAKHVEVPGESVFRILTYAEYKSLGPKGLADILESQHIAVKDMPMEEFQEKRFGFDEEGLRTLSPLHAKIEMQDLSLPSGIEGTARLVSRTVAELLQVSRDPNGRILNALEFPFRAKGTEQPPCSVDFVAWEVAAEMSYEDNMEGFPFPHTRWGLAGLRGAFTFWHLDSDGFNTFVDVKNEEGEKWWIVADGSRVCTSQLQLLLGKGFDLQTGPSDLPLEAILLTKGTRLIMRANTLHAVLTPEHTICHGGHFYCTKTMQATAAGLIHAFVCHTFITNTSHLPSWQLLRRILYFFHQGLVQQLFSTSSSEFTHLPQLPSSKGENASVHEVLALLSLCNLHILANALNFGTYLDDASPDKHTANTNFDFNNISFEQRRSIWRCRAVCIDIFGWFRQHYVVEKQGTEVDLVSLYLVHQASTILRYKREVDRREHPSLEGCTVARLTKQINAALEVDDTTHRIWISGPAKWRDCGFDDSLLEESLLLQDADQYRVFCRGPLEVGKNSNFGDVLTSLDRQYLAGRKWTVKVEKDALALFTANNLG